MILQAPIVNPVIPGLSRRNPSEAVPLFAKLIAAIVGIFLIVATIWALIQLLLGGINWISSGGDKNRLETAQHQIQNALIGLVITFASWAVFILIIGWLGISPVPGQFRFKLPTLF